MIGKSVELDVLRFLRADSILLWLEMVAIEFVFFLLHVGAELEELIGHLLVGLSQDIDQLSCLRLVEGCEKSVGDSGLAGSARSTNPVNVILDGQGESVVDHIFHVGDIQTSGCHIGGNQQRLITYIRIS